MKIISIKETYNWKDRYEVVVGDIEYYQQPIEGPSKEVRDGYQNNLVFIKEIAPNIYSYGAKQLTNGVHHGAGYIWSSRASEVNQVLGTNLIEVKVPVPGCSALLQTVAMDVDTLREILPQDYKIIKNKPWENATEESYWVVKEDYDESSAN